MRFDKIQRDSGERTFWRKKMTGMMIAEIFKNKISAKLSQEHNKTSLGYMFFAKLILLR